MSSHMYIKVLNIRVFLMIVRYVSVVLSPVQHALPAIPPVFQALGGNLLWQIGLGRVLRPLPALLALLLQRLDVLRVPTAHVTGGALRGSILAHVESLVRGAAHVRGVFPDHLRVVPSGLHGTAPPRLLHGAVLLDLWGAPCGKLRGEHAAWDGFVPRLRRAARHGSGAVAGGVLDFVVPSLGALGRALRPRGAPAEVLARVGKLLDDLIHLVFLLEGLTGSSVLRRVLHLRSGLDAPVHGVLGEVVVPLEHGDAVHAAEGIVRLEPGLRGLLLGVPNLGGLLVLLGLLALALFALGRLAAAIGLLLVAVVDGAHPDIAGHREARGSSPPA